LPFPSQADFVSEQILSKIPVLFPSQASFVSLQIPSKIPLCFFLLKQILLLCKFLRAFSFSSKFRFSANSFENSFVPFLSQADFAFRQIPSEIRLY